MTEVILEFFFVMVNNDYLTLDRSFYVGASSFLARLACHAGKFKNGSSYSSGRSRSKVSAANSRSVDEFAKCGEPKSKPGGKASENSPVPVPALFE